VSLAIVAGSGLAALADVLAIEETIPFENIDGVGAATVHGHAGNVLRGTINGRACQLLVGRRHFYEGDAKPIERLIDFVAGKGATALLVTSAAGGLQRGGCAGDLVVIHDIIDYQNRRNTTQTNEYRARLTPSRGMTIDARLTRLFEEAATGAGVPWQRGVSACASGPLYETVADVGLQQFMGAHVATMSGAPEVTRANEIGLPAAAVAVVTNPCTGIDASVPDHLKVLAASAEAARGLQRVISQFIEKL
jgi:inosine/guanosine/xanthosine phosphorylase family protein